MKIPDIGATLPTPPIPESAEPKGPELKNDHDADDVAGAKPPVSPTPTRGQGTVVDTKA